MLRCVYTDLDGTLLTAGSLFRSAEGGFTLLPARALEACHRAGVEVVIKSGRRKAQVMEDARLIGQTAYIYEMGCGLVIDGEETMLTGDLRPQNGRTIHDQIEDSGAPRLLLETYAGRLEYHEPWHLNREISHLMRGLVDAFEADSLLEQHGHANLRLVDNGAIVPRTTLPDLEGPPHVYHLIPREASKADAVAATCAPAATRPRTASRWATRARISASRPPWAASSSWPTPCRRTRTSCVERPPTSRSRRAATARASTRP